MEKMKRNILKHLLNNYSYIVIGFISVVLIISVIIVGKDLIIEPHDNLDYNTIYTAFAHDNNYFTSFDGEIPYLGGISRLLMPSNLNVMSLIYYYFSPFHAYIIVYLLKIFIGTTSFILLMREMLGEDKCADNKNIIILIAFTFGLLPGYPLAYLASSSLPLVLYLLIRIYKNPKKTINYVYLFLYPSLSHLIFYGIFIIGYIFIFIIYDLIKNKSKKLWIAFMVVLLSYVIIDFRLFYAMFFLDIETIKSTIVTANYSFIDIITVFINGQYHAGSVHKILILPLTFLFFTIHNIKNIIKKKSIFTIPNLIMLLLLFNTLVFALYRTDITRELIFKLIPPLEGINFSRTIFFNPILWYLMFYIIVSKINSKIITSCAVLLQLAIVIFMPVAYNDIYINIAEHTNHAKVNETEQVYSYRQYYSEKLFEDIKMDIDYSGEYAVAFRFHPSVLTYNGINTLDGYCSYYSKEYKDEFRELALPQLQQNEDNLKSFDTWGGRAYLFSNEVAVSDFNSYNSNDLIGNGSENLYINIDKFHELNGVFIFSNGEISNAQEQKLKLIGKYKNKESLYQIYVYKSS